MKFRLKQLKGDCDRYAEELILLDKKHDIVFLNHQYKLSNHIVKINIKLEFTIR